MSEIPEDVMKAAQAVVDLHRHTEGSALKRSDAMIDYIARAMLAAAKKG